jgi:hypothetical protein
VTESGAIDRGSTMVQGEAVSVDLNTVIARIYRIMVDVF